MNTVGFELHDDTLRSYTELKIIAQPITAQSSELAVTCGEEGSLCLPS